VRKVLSLLPLLFLCAFTILPAQTGMNSPEPPLRVGVFEGHGAAASCVERAFEALRIDPAIEPRLVSADDILSGALASLDVLVLPGGGGARQMNNLGSMGVDKVRDFVLSGGKGVVGICAGAYMLSDTPGYACLHLCGVSAVDMEHDERGRGIVAFAPTERGYSLFPELEGAEKRHMFYYEGPLFTPAANGSPYEVLATFASDVHLENRSPEGVMPGKPALLRAEAGRGRVFLSSTHPEATPGLRWMLPRMARWVARRDSLPYSRAAVRVDACPREVLFDAALRQEEEALFRRASGGAPPERAAAVRRLAEIRSWDGPQWTAGCLRGSDPEVRRAAALALAELEVTSALPDVRGVLAIEKDAGTRATLAFAEARLASMVPAVEPRPPASPSRKVAVTFDDLPAVSLPAKGRESWENMTAKLLDALRTRGIPVVGFVNAGKLEGESGPEPWKVDLLKAWLKSGAELGNHTYSHCVLHDSTLEAFEEDLLKGDAALRPILAEHGQALRYFRHPCLMTGRDAATKEAVSAFLRERGYTVAPVTLDNSEWIFARAYANALGRGDEEAGKRVRDAYIPYMEAKTDYFEKQSLALFGREVSQVLLVHANQLNADAFPSVAGMLRDRGYRFVTLGDALEDDAYSLPDGFFGFAGISWLHRWCFALGGKYLVVPGEPRCPEWVMREAGVGSE
jgi:peptidoglycan/xylan/chitin deacetylase (PgdA/CDA1 family)/glutamine amidotransferase-like uncharacterized protein